MTSPFVLAVDGGNSKTDLALVRGSGEVLALVRGPQSSPHHLGVEGCLGVLDDLLARIGLDEDPLLLEQEVRPRRVAGRAGRPLLVPWEACLVA